MQLSCVLLTWDTQNLNLLGPEIISVAMSKYVHP